MNIGLKAIVLYGAVMLTQGASANCLINTSPHACLSSSDPVVACTTALESDGFDSGTRMALCQAHLADNDFDRAALTLRKGIDLCSGRACRELELALSNVEEQRARSNQNDPGEAQRKQDAQRAYCMGPIANDRSISACELLLGSTPRDAEVLLALGTKLHKKGRPAEALVYLQRAKRYGNTSNTLGSQIASASKARSALKVECLRDTSLATCNAALLPGARDEAEILRHKGKLLSDNGSIAQARRSLVDAWNLQPGNARTADLLVALPGSAFGDSDAASLLTLADAHALRANVSAERAVLERIIATQPDNNIARERLLGLLPGGSDQLASEPATQERERPDRSPQIAATPPAETPVLPPPTDIQRRPEPTRDSPPSVVATTPAALEPTTVDPTTRSPEPPTTTAPTISASSPTLALNSIGADGRTH